MTEIIIAAISSLSMLFIALLNAYVKNKNLKSENQNLQSDKERLVVEISAITILFNHKFLSILEDQIEDLFNNTKASRFLILFAVNGKESFQFVTACYEKNKYPYARGATKRYVRFKIDDHYKKMLKTVEKIGTIEIVTEDLPPSTLKKIYQSYKEKIKYAYFQFVKRIKIDSDNDLILYSTIATVENIPFTEEESLLIQQAYDVIRYEAKKLIIYENH